MPKPELGQTSGAHTPGPWRWFDYPDGRKLLAADSRAVIHCPDAPMACEPADQHLIAAAPDLLAAAKAAYVALPMAKHNEPINRALAEAIDKAEGRVRV
jgi:hypothetical protein